jgi:hypothetical protein
MFSQYRGWPSMESSGLGGRRGPDATIDISAAVRDTDQCKPATDTCAKLAAMTQHLHDLQFQPSLSLAPSKMHRDTDPAQLGFPVCSKAY